MHTAQPPWVVLPVPNSITRASALPPCDQSGDGIEHQSAAVMYQPAQQCAVEESDRRGNSPALLLSHVREPSLYAPCRPGHQSLNPAKNMESCQKQSAFYLRN